jgi:hypothetical protein
MALEIKELEIRMRVGGDEESAPRKPTAETCGEVDQRQIVDDSVRRVLQALRSLEER